MNDTHLFSFNGINGATGDYLLPAMSVSKLSKIAQGEKFDKEHLNDLKLRNEWRNIDHFSSYTSIDPKDLGQTGWGIIFAYDDRDKVAAWQEALKPLLDLRKEQAGDLYKEFIGPDGYRPGESKNKFLCRHSIGSGPADPEKMPYYLLIVADPETIPFHFQYHLAVQYAVGRICFDTLDEYANYALSVVRTEKGEFIRSPKAAFFGVQNPADQATMLSAVKLVQPLADWMSEEKPDWSIQTLLKDEATKANFANVLNSADGPALLFTAGHGMGFHNGDLRQLPHQGALLCQDWPGPLHWQGKPIPEDFYFSADDVSADADLGGMITFHFASYSAGTPQQDDFAHPTFRDIVPLAFTARLPQRLLGHPRGGTLAFIGQWEQAWGCSFVWKRPERQRAVFESTLKRLSEGHPVGSALESFTERYAEFSSELTTVLENVKYGIELNDLELAGMWTANNDARSYMIIGDPAVRLLTSATGTEMPTPLISEQKPKDERLDHTVTITTSNKAGKKKESTWEVSLAVLGGEGENKKDEHLAELHRKIVGEAKKVWQGDSSIIAKDGENKG